MAHLRIQVLGPLAAWRVTDEGVWEHLKLSEQGWSVAGLIVALIFYPNEEKHGMPLAPLVWDDTEAAREDKLENRLRAVLTLARNALGPCRDALSSGGDYYLINRDDSLGPRQVYVDWDDAQRYSQEGRYREALSLFSGLPLPLFPDKDGRLGNLAEQTRETVSSAIAANLQELGLPTPEKPSWAQLEDFADLRPTDWIPRVSRKQVPTPTTGATPGDERVKHPRAPSPFGSFDEAQLFEVCHEGHARLAREQDEAASEEREFWWGSHQWFGKYLALWHKTLGTPCEEIKFTYVDDVYDAARFGLKDVDEPKEKATLIEAPKQLGDNDNKQIICGKTNWGLAHTWATKNEGALLDHPSKLSVFGILGRPAYPNILGVHTLVQTSDRFLLFALRSPEVDFHQLTWSASFEESISVNAREFTGPLTGDGTVLDPVRGGLYEEWGIEEHSLLDSHCLAIGREWVREEDAKGARLNLSPTILTVCRLKLSLAEVWANLDETFRIRDREEHRAWAGCWFADREAVLRFVADARGRRNNVDLLKDLAAESKGQVKVEHYPGNATRNVRDHGLMPTSPARLLLGSAWLAYSESIDKSVT